MSFEKILEWSVTYGLGTVLAFLIAFAFWRTLIYVLKENTKREERLANIIEKHIDSLSTALINVHNSITQSHVQIQELKEANKLQREEHREMIKFLQLMQNEVSAFMMQVKEK